MATRVGIRCMDAIRTANSRFFFWSCALFLTADHYDDLKMYLPTVLAKINAGVMWTDLGEEDEAGNPIRAAHIEISVGDQCEVCIVADGGDAAAANALAGLEPPPSRHGCCSYCELRRVNWFNRDKCKAAKRRNFCAPASLPTPCRLVPRRALYTTAPCVRLPLHISRVLLPKKPTPPSLLLHNRRLT